MELSCSGSDCRPITHTENDWKGGEITIQIRGDFRLNYRYASIYINGVHRTGCNPNTHYGSYYTCGSFSVPPGSVTIRVQATDYVSAMQVKISGNIFHGSKVHFIHIFFKSNDKLSNAETCRRVENIFTSKILFRVLCFKESVLY